MSEPDSEPDARRGWRAFGHRAAAWLIFLPVLIGLLLLVYLFISSGAQLLEAS